VKAADYCGVKSGRNTDKFKDMKLTPVTGEFVKIPMIEESPVNIECRVKQILPLGSHHMFVAEVLGVHINPDYLNKTGKFELNKAEPVVYSHGEYYGLGEMVGTFGYSVKKRKRK
jgi:flavin reductase (DIM6/NTAB) family NADH-FMN oxidoreductase RutF